MQRTRPPNIPAALATLQHSTALLRAQPTAFRAHHLLAFGAIQEGLRLSPQNYPLNTRVKSLQGIPELFCVVFRVRFHSDVETELLQHLLEPVTLLAVPGKETQSRRQGLMSTADLSATPTEVWEADCAS